MKTVFSKDIFSQLLVLLLIAIICLLLGQGISYILFKIGGLSLDPSLFSELDTTGKRQLARVALIAGHFISFSLAGVIFLYVFHRSSYASYLKLQRLPSVSFLYLSFFLLLCCYPLVGKISEYNLSLPLPDWMVTSSESAMGLLKGILDMQGPMELIVALLLVGIVPAIGEELLYRGILQQKMQQWFQNDHLGILVASLLFSLNHFQFDRFLPFAFLGLILGYAYYYSRSFWIPVFLHFINNSFQVALLYFSEDGVKNLDITEMPDIPNSVLLISIVAAVGVFFLLRRHSVVIFPHETDQV